MAENISGGYTMHPTIGKEEQAIFDAALRHHVGVDYKPLAVASQVVDGINYIYICTGKIVVPHAETKLYAIKIYTKFRHSIAPTLEIRAIDEIDPASLIKE